MMHMNSNHPEAILADIQRGYYPSSWQVIKGNLSLKRALKEFFSNAMLISGLVVMFICAAGVTGILSTFMLLVMQIFIFIASFANKLKTARDSVLVLAPDCFMHYSRVSDPNPMSHAFIGHFYANIASFSIRQNASNAGAILDIRYHNGQKFRWICDNAFAPALQTARDIIVAHARYVALHSNIYLPESYMASKQ